MTYLPIKAAPDTPAPIRKFVHERVDPILHDVRAMLGHRQRDDDPGFNLSLVTVLCGVIGGLSRVFYRSEKDDSCSFALVAERYPLSQEPKGALSTPSDFASKLYKTYRNNLVHSFGLAISWNKEHRQYEQKDLGREYKVVRHAKLPLGERKLAALEYSTRPEWLEPTLWTDGGVTRLCADSLYWGVRQLVQLLAEDGALHASALGILTDAESMQVLSSAAPTQHLLRNGVRGTLTALSVTQVNPTEDP